MRTKSKKGFTLIELIIVVTVISVLAAILIPTFINLNNKAREASDQSLVKNLNTAMSTEEGEGKKNDTYHDAITYLNNYGFKLANLATKSEYDLLWNSKSNRFLLNNPTALQEDKDETGAEDFQYWTIKDSIPEGNTFSIYAGLNFSEENPVNVTGVGFDAGNHNFETINYTGNENTNKVLIRTNGGSLNVTAPLDTIRHYGNAKIVTLTSVSPESYYEYGVSNLVDIKNGRLVITNTKDAEVGTIYLTATENAYDGIILATQKGSELPEVVAREEVELPTGDNKKLVVTIQTDVNHEGKNPTKTEAIYLYPAKDVKEETAGYNVSDLGLLVVEAISSDARTQAATQLEEKGEAVINKVKEEKTQDISGISTGALYYAGGNGSAKSPYLISNAEELSNVRQALDANFKVINDIDMSEVTDWEPIGNANDLTPDNYQHLNSNEGPFRGRFDGAGYAIKNWNTEKPLFGTIFGLSKTEGAQEPSNFLYTNTTTAVLDDSHNLVNSINENAFSCVVKNVNYDNCSITLGRKQGGIANLVADAYFGDCEIRNSNIYYYEGFYTGTFVGDVYRSYVRNLHLAKDNIVTSNLEPDLLANTGIMIGSIGGGLADELFAKLVVNGEAYSWKYNKDSTKKYRSWLGSYEGSGYTNFVNDGATYRDKYYTVIDHCVNDASAQLSYNYGWIGGILGMIYSYSQLQVITDCVNNGNITINHIGTEASIGGICGGNSSGGAANFIRCSNNGNITMTGTASRGTSGGYNQLSGICSYSNGPYVDCSNTGNLTGDIVYIGGICAKFSSNTSSRVSNCTNTGQLINLYDQGKTGEICADSKTLNEITTNQLAGGNYYRVKLTDAGSCSGALSVPESISYIEADGFGFNEVNLSNKKGTLELKVSNATFNLTGNTQNASITIKGTNNTVTIGEGVVLNNVKIDGAGSTITNNGTINHLAIANTNTTNTNNCIMGSVEFVGSNDLVMTFNNNGVIGQNNEQWHTVQTQSQINLTFNNDGTIYGNGTKYGLLFYGMSNVTFNAGVTSELIIENAQYTAVFFNVETMRANSVTFNVDDGAAGLSDGSYYGITTHLSGGVTQVTVNVNE